MFQDKQHKQLLFLLLHLHSEYSQHALSICHATARCAKFIPKPNSALSSNKEFAQDGPRPCLFTVYGVDGAEPAPNRRTACCIGNHHSVAEQLSYQFSIRSLTTACTSTGELEQWLFKLTSFYSRCFKFLKYLRFFINGLTIVIYFLERHLSVNWFHNQCFLASLPGHTCAQQPQPVQSSVETVITNFRSGIPVIFIDFVASGAAATSASVIGIGRITE